MAKPKQNGTAMVKWEEQLAKEAQLAQDTAKDIGTGGQFISLKNGHLTVDGAEVPDDKMEVVIIDYVLENAWYEGAYNPDAITGPACFAFGRSLSEMKIHENSTKPQGGEDGGCEGCPLNEYGTADKGKGKACGNRVRMGLIVSADLEDIENAEVRYLKLPPTSLKSWAGYVNQLAVNLKRPPFAVITEISVVDDVKSQFRVVFRVVEPIEDATKFEALMNKKRAVESEIEFPYTPAVEAPAPVKAPARRVPAKATVVPPSPRLSPTKPVAARTAVAASFGGKGKAPKF